MTEEDERQGTAGGDGSSIPLAPVAAHTVTRHHPA